MTDHPDTPPADPIAPEAVAREVLNEETHDYSCEHWEYATRCDCDRPIRAMLVHAATVRDAAFREGLERAAEAAATMWPRGSAHTYASENADVYRAYEDAGECIAQLIRTLVREPRP